MKKKLLLLSGVVAFSFTAQAQYLRDNYVSWGGASEMFGTTLQKWTPGSQVSEDDNFFISRIKPKARFRNAATQVMDTLQTTYDKKLICWLPINSINETGWNRNALPDGLFDSEVFSMWSYVTHWGDWTAPLGRVPAALLDVAHKNGVAVSGVASVPYTAIPTSWANCFLNMINEGADKTAQYMNYYGLDGFGYNSEWSETSVVVTEKLIPYHVALVKKMRETNPLFENIWYGGTTDIGGLSFSDMLDASHSQVFGNSDNIASSLFLNYNWWYSYKITPSLRLAKTMGRDPLDLYAGFNMQGANPTAWNTLAQTRYSIGLWGAHSANMFFETRHEKGSDPAVKQRTYMLRTERWFGGGTRNPANLPKVLDSSNYNADNFSFHGMAKLMSARSSLCWNLSEEPFITYFNLGNGKFFNWNGRQQNNREWYNLGVQDYLPTWRYWFTSSLLGRKASDVPETGLDAEFTWNDAYVGGSTMHVTGTTNNEYLHLFKTQFALQEGDVITFRYKLLKGKANANFVFTAEGAEGTAINEADYNVLTTAQEADEEEWITKQFTVTGDLAGKTLALVALHFQQAQDLDLYFGEFSIVRGTSATPAKPEVTSAKILASHRDGVDAKLIWNMPNLKAAGEPCYNTDVNTSLFKIYSQQEGQEPVFMGVTTSWAGLVFSAPVDFTNGTANKVRLGVSALSLDHKSESAIAWSDYMETGVYTYNDNIQTSKNFITQNEEFTMSYVDPNHESGTWTLIHQDGTTAFSGEGNSVTVPGLEKLGSYTLKLDGKTHSGTTVKDEVRTYDDYVTIEDAKFGRLPEVLTLTANGEEAGIQVEKGDQVQMAYTGRNSDGGTSQAVDLKEKNFGFSVLNAGLTGKASFSLAFWLKVNNVPSGTQFFAVADKAGNWPLTDWGWNWSTLDKAGALVFTYRNSSRAENPPASKYEYPAGTLPIGVWAHVAIVFDRKSDGTARHQLYVNGKFVEPTVYQDGAVTTDKYLPVLDMDGTVGNDPWMCIGGPASGRGGIDGIVDNFQLWKKAISEEEVQASMGALDPSNLPAGLSCFWNFETKAADGKGFVAVGATPGLEAGSYELIKLEGEGRAQPHYVDQVYTAGCPAALDAGYPVLTEASWKAVKATITDITGNGEAGSAKVSYAKDGLYNVSVTLANPLGSDTKTYSAIRVGEDTGINEVEGAELRTYTVGDVVYVEFAEGGNYEVQVYNVAGQLVAAKAATLTKADRMQVRLPQTGVFVLRVARDGKAVKALKLLRE
ncbi:MAG: endo-beta-N-acetylglucosaminidase [Alloprevotella sp.]|nr:endo-beta-N-acetylglucosaminidase [Alloprevotella sp.]